MKSSCHFRCLKFKYRVSQIIGRRFSCLICGQICLRIERFSIVNQDERSEWVYLKQPKAEVYCPQCLSDACIERSACR